MHKYSETRETWETYGNRPSPRTLTLNGKPMDVKAILEDEEKRPMKLVLDVTKLAS